MQTEGQQGPRYYIFQTERDTIVRPKNRRTNFRGDGDPSIDRFGRPRARAGGKENGGLKACLLERPPEREEEGSRCIGQRKGHRDKGWPFPH